MWSTTLSNVEPTQNPPLSSRSGVVADTPPRRGSHFPSDFPATRMAGSSLRHNAR